MDGSVEEQGAAPPLSIWQKISFGSGDLGISMTWGLATGYLLVYWSDVALLPVAALGPLMLTVRVLDAIFDPLVGILVDRTRTRFGKARPYLLWAAIPFGLLSVAVFTVPPWSPSLKLIYAYATFISLGFCYSLLYIPYGAMLPMLARDRGEKVQLASFRSMGTSFASFLVYASAWPVIGLFGGDRQSGFTAIAAILGIVSASVLIGITFRNCRERETMRQTQTARVPLWRGFRQILANPVWRIACGITFLLLAKMFSLVSSFAYFSRDVLGDIAWMTRILPFLSVVIMAGGFVASFFFRKIGIRSGNIGWLVVSIVLAAAMPLFEGRPWPYFTLFLASQFGGAFQAASIFILSAEAIELQRVQHGVRLEGLMTASVAFSTKLGMAFGTAATAFLLDFAHYVPGRHSAETAMAVSWLFYGSQILCMVLMIVCISFYRGDAGRSGTSKAA